RVYASHNVNVGADELYEAYVLRTRSVVEDVGDRVVGFGIRPVAWAYEQWGFFGAGLGAGTQGAQHFGADSLVEKGRGAAEGGLGKIMLELGAPGLVLIVWLIVAMVRYVSRTLDSLVALSSYHARLGFGLT